MALRLIALSLCAIASLGVNAADSYSVAWDAPEFTTVTGFFTLPKLPISDGGSSPPFILIVPTGPEFRGTPGIPWGPGFNVSAGEDMKFLFNNVSASVLPMGATVHNMVRKQTGAGRWVVEVGWATGGGAHGVFDLGDSVLNRQVISDFRMIPTKLTVLIDV
ncbi:hypothetical protein PQX77_012278 [Marasmius sp. AFHP31]|nr:hypothetical protein PQX77_012278 [Marasmius sp. AFHP31]